MAENAKKLQLADETIAELKRLAENVSKETVEAIFKIADIEIKASKTKFDDLLLPALPLIKDKIMEVLEKISEE